MDDADVPAVWQQLGLPGLVDAHVHDKPGRRRWRSPTARSGRHPFPAQLMSRLHHMEHKVLLGSDVPNTAYPYAHQGEVLQRLCLGDSWLRSVLHGNGARVLLRP